MSNRNVEKVSVFGRLWKVLNDSERTIKNQHLSVVDESNTLPSQLYRWTVSYSDICTRQLCPTGRKKKQMP